MFLRVLSRTRLPPPSRVTPRLWLATPRRTYATPPPQIKPSPLTVDRYNELSDATMDTLWDRLEELIDSHSFGYEVEYSSGVLTLKLGDKGTYVINKQPPNKQIWLSSPISGPKRYDYNVQKDTWFYSRDGELMGELLNRELGDAFSENIDLGLGTVSDKVV